MKPSDLVHNGKAQLDFSKSMIYAIFRRMATPVVVLWWSSYFDPP